MAQKVTVIVVDDLDGSADAYTVQFSLDGTNYEIDLAEHNIQRLWHLLEPYVKAGRLTRS